MAAISSFARHGKKIVAIGRNYAEHIKELSNTTPKEPFFFLKPTTTYLPSGGKVEIPNGILCHHEVELGLVIGKRGRDISQANADTHIAGYALAVDMTARNLQEQVKSKGLPWSAAKGFDTFTPIGSFIPKSDVKDPHDLRLWLKINGAFKQNGTTSDMIFRIPRLIEHISSIMTLEEGDLVLTGTPAGVGPINAGDVIECALSDGEGKNLAKLSFGVVDREGGYQFKP
ncbi:MAG: hypothetical protein NXY57DRAFT_1022695 [Lentinula lateritia]|uniref:Fumarylacetoacetase-like C-terminal domain-containing protein n=1 Tax=Lentinula lateritia TaxID=40482 RepID=A0ABQ8VQJ1_9AGAR|nr:MAG: hypothetical protein NXY57DRAFT_1022695 [Lentinula lateritia]KAJ4498571.1 hypothetical protein C8R41DRAFT_818465 [Lentinula lateritia]